MRVKLTFPVIAIRGEIKGVGEKRLLVWRKLGVLKNLVGAGQTTKGV
jgi:hypothetical protein